jgi:hypothetical protein
MNNKFYSIVILRLQGVKFQTAMHSTDSVTLRLKASQATLLVFQLLMGIITAMKTFTLSPNYCRTFDQR